MAATKHKKNKTNQTKIKKTIKPSKKSEQWEKVKIRGKVISDDGLTSGFEGLIGLEVLENYDNSMVGIGKPKKQKTIKQDKNAEKQKSKLKPKDAARAEPTKKKQKDKLKKTGNKEYPPERFALLRPPAEDDEAAEKAENENEEELDKVPELMEEVPELVDVTKTKLEIDDLVGWNGLGVPQSILRAIAERGFKSPSEIQALTLPAAILGKKDILGAAETGSGKTLAFGIPVLAGIMELKSKNLSSGIRKAGKIESTEPTPPSIPTKRRKNDQDRELTPPPEELNFRPQIEANDNESESDDENNEDKEEISTEDNKNPLYALILTPTRELAVQVKDHLVAAAKYTGIKVATIFGGLSLQKQERILKKCPEIVVATPGRFWELYQQENPHLSKLEHISFLVIDETDRMVEKGHFEELKNVLKVLNEDEARKRTRQNFVFSATLTLVHDLPDHMQKRNTGKSQKFIKPTPGLKLQNLIEELGISQPKVVDITRSQQTAQTLMECRLMCSIDEKDYYLYYFIERHPGRTIVFCNSIDCVKRLATLFGLLECNPLSLHANMIQKQRLKNLERFRDNPNGLLIATDVAARGLDIPNVEHVIHYQVPRTSENYVHRSGRTARASKDGITVMFMEPAEVKNYLKLYKTLDRSEDLPLFPVSEKYFGAVKERVNLARDLDKEELKLRRTQSDIGWMKKTAEEMDIIIDGYNDESGSDQDEDPYIIEKRRNRMRLESLRMNLRNLLAKPIFPKGFSFKYPMANTQMGTSKEAANNNLSAVKLMQKAIEERKEEKKMRNKRRKRT